MGRVMLDSLSLSNLQQNNHIYSRFHPAVMNRMQDGRSSQKKKKKKLLQKLQPDIAPSIALLYQTFTRSILHVLSYTPSLVGFSQEI